MGDDPEAGNRRDPLVERIELTPLFVPFREVVRETMSSGEGGLGMAIAAEEPWTGGDFVVCRMVAVDGTVGLGEVFVWLPETGVSPAQVIDACDSLGRCYLGRSALEMRRIRDRLDVNVARGEVAKGLLDMACWDLAARSLGVPAWELMGGPSPVPVPLAALVPLVSTEAMVFLARGFRGAGWGTLRLKLGRGAVKDEAIVAAVREAVGDGVRLRVDYNQAYTVEEAVAAIRAIEPYGIDCAEQPVRAGDFAGMASVQRRVDTPLMAHEGCFSLDDVVTLAELGAIGVVGLNSERPGGVTRALEAIAFAGSRGMGVVIHNQSLGIASACQIHLASARFGSLGHAVELFGGVMFPDDLIDEEIDCSGGSGTVPAGPGYGVSLDRDAVSDFASGPTLTLEPK